jgi:hypothetical protein
MHENLKVNLVVFHVLYIDIYEAACRDLDYHDESCNFIPSGSGYLGCSKGEEAPLGHLGLVLSSVLHPCLTLETTGFKFRLRMILAEVYIDICEKILLFPPLRLSLQNDIFPLPR